MIFYFNEFHFWNVWRFIQSLLQDLADKSSAVNCRIAQAFQNIWDCAEMVIVSVGNQKCLDIFFLFFKITCVWDYPVNAWSFLDGELDAHINDDYLVVIFEERAISPDFF